MLQWSLPSWAKARSFVDLAFTELSKRHDWFSIAMVSQRRLVGLLLTGSSGSKRFADHRRFEWLLVTHVVHTPVLPTWEPVVGPSYAVLAANESLVHGTTLTISRPSRGHVRALPAPTRSHRAMKRSKLASS